jgi:hypothetical protein
MSIDPKLLEIAVQAAYPYTSKNDVRYGFIEKGLLAYEAAKASEQPDEFILNQIISEIDDAGQGKISPERLKEAANFCMSFIKRESIDDVLLEINGTESK